MSSINTEKNNPAKNTRANELIFFITSGNRKPNGTNITILPAVF
jgi:hypothetical protein